MVVGKVGLVVNPTAGLGEEYIKRLLLQLLPKLRSVPTVIAKRTLEAALAKRLAIQVKSVDRPKGSGFGYIARLTETMLEQEVDTVIGIGGDGTLCDIANVMIARGKSARLLGIGAGSANVGPLVTVRGEDIEALELTRLKEASIHGIGVRVNGRPVGVTFNDVTFSNLFFGTQEGVRVDLDAGAMLKGERKVTRPISVCGDKTRVYKNNELVLSSVDEKIAQIIVSPINNAIHYSGKAVSGLMCWGPYLGNHGLLAAASTILIRTHVSKEELGAVEPLDLRQVTFGSEDLVEVTGLKENAVLVVDGNPVVVLSPTDRIGFCLKPSVVRAFHLPGG